MIRSLEKDNLSFHGRVVQLRLLLPPATMKKQAIRGQQISSGSVIRMWEDQNL